MGMLADMQKIGDSMDMWAQLYDALKRGKSAQIGAKLAVWVDWTNRQPRYIVSELLANGRTIHTATLDGYLEVQAYLRSRIADGTINRTPKLLVF